MLGAARDLGERVVERAPAGGTRGEGHRGVLALVDEALTGEPLRPRDVGRSGKRRGRGGQWQGFGHEGSGFSARGPRVNGRRPEGTGNHPGMQRESNAPPWLATTIPHGTADRADYPAPRAAAGLRAHRPRPRG